MREPRTKPFLAVAAVCTLAFSLVALDSHRSSPARRDHSQPAKADAAPLARSAADVHSAQVAHAAKLASVASDVASDVAATVEHTATPVAGKARKPPTRHPARSARSKPKKTAHSHGGPRPGFVNIGHYIRSIRGTRHDVAIMRTLGARDARANSRNRNNIALLDIGGQVHGGVFLSTTHRFISYASLVRAVIAYAQGYHQRQHAHTSVVIAIGTNNDLAVNAAAGSAWARQVVNPVRAYATRFGGITIAGADDIEPGFQASPAATRAWVRGFLANTRAPFVFNGAADGCSWTHISSRCNRGWTSRDLVGIAAFAAPSRTLVLPQIYNAAMAGQWAQLAEAARLSHRPMNIVGPLTENRACGRDPSCPTMPTAQAWTRLWRALHSTRAGINSLPTTVDLDVR